MNTPFSHIGDASFVAEQVPAGYELASILY